MRQLIVAFVVAGFGTAEGVRAADSARDVIDKAIQAHGGADKLTRLRAVVRLAKGELSFGGVGAVPVVCEATLMPPEQGRWSFELEANGQKIPLIVAVNGTKGWRSGGGTVKDMTKPEVEEHRAEAYVAWLMSLLPLKEAGFELAPLAEVKIGEVPAVGVKVTRKGYPDVKLYFDKKTGLLAKAERKGKEAGIDTTKEYFFGEPKDYGGLMLPTRFVEKSNGKKVAEWTISSYKFPGRIDAKEFAKP